MPAAVLGDGKESWSGEEEEVVEVLVSQLDIGSGDVVDDGERESIRRRLGGWR